MREFNTKYINLFTLLTDLLYNWWVILLAAIIGFSGCQVYNSAFVVEKYTSTATIAVNLSGYTDNATVTSLTRTIEIATAFQNVLGSSALVDVVEEKIDSKITGTLTAVQKPETNLIDISVTDISPEKAYMTLKAVYENYTVLTDNAFSNIIISVMTPPSMATKSNTSAQTKDSLVVAFLCTVLCIFIILVISYFRDTVKNISDVEALLDLKLFGSINHINKKNRKIKKEIIGLMMTNPLVNYKFSNSFREMAIKLLSIQRTKGIKSTMVTSIAENEGKTTVSVNLGLALAEIGKKVVIVDCDFKLPSVYKFFKDCPVGENNELVDYIRGNTDYESIIRFDKRTNLYIIGGQKQYRNSSEIINNKNFDELISRLHNDFDYVIIDTPPGGVAIDSEIISEKTDSMLLVVRQDFVTVEPINDYISNINQSKLLGCVFNNVSSFKDTYNSETSKDYYI
ncbi:MAG: polysaccharide biosynthesis tyrosine autokinase [Clostridia bacterium]|nr:polysaccharide biosynthesis tyrosine autokinase [Clostridia bacterium]